MSNKERIFIIVDGNNFYHRLKETFQLEETKLLDFRYKDFANWLARDRQIAQKEYCVGCSAGKTG